jgi:hypothetical protein
VAEGNKDAHPQAKHQVTIKAHHHQGTTSTFEAAADWRPAVYRESLKMISDHTPTWQQQALRTVSKAPQPQMRLSGMRHVIMN